MNIKIKTTLIIIVTLIIGIIIGAMLNRALVQNRIRRAYAMVNPDRFISTFEQVIQPNPQQQKQVKNIIQEHAKRISQIRENFRQDMASSFESLRKKLESVLTPEQKRRLKKILRRPRPPWRRQKPPDKRPKPPYKKQRDILF